MQDRAQRFDVGSAPLLRCTLARFSDAEHRLIVSHHHLLMDGWSGPVLIDELLTLYEQEEEASTLPRVTPYRDYLAWLARQDRTAALAAWREALAGLEEATHLCGQKARHKPVAPEQIALGLDETLTASLNEQARRRGVTLNSMLQAAWAIAAWPAMQP